MDEFGHGRVASLTRIGNRLVKPATLMEGSATLVQVALQGDKGKLNFYDVNLVDGYKSITFQFRSPHGLFHSYAPSEATRKTYTICALKNFKLLTRMGKSLLAKVLSWRSISICFVAETSLGHLKIQTELVFKDI
ncbi:hypothetical protein V6N13_083808 [Hibiscus sabdariffa]|uniref:Uncharacterized protein n=1 Tax=Hibiscus sabdariffa TaxID=183260 RepID=A0ABR2SZD2_9ROSI